MTAPSIAFIGLGVQGLPLAVNLAAAGHAVAGFDPDPRALSQFAESGGVASASVADAAQGATVVFICVATDKQILDVVLGEGGVVDHAAPGAIVVSHCTISAETAATLAIGIAAAGLRFADVPVSGGAKGAAERTMSYMVGCEDEVFAVCEPLFRVSGQAILRTGPAGTATIGKLAHQVTIIGNILAMAEGMRLGTAAGMAPDIVKTVITGGLARSWIAETWGEVKMAPHALPIYRKDLENGLALARAHGAELPGAETALAHLETIVP